MVLMKAHLTVKFDATLRPSLTRAHVLCVSRAGFQILGGLIGLVPGRGRLDAAALARLACRLAPMPVPCPVCRKSFVKMPPPPS